MHVVDHAPQHWFLLDDDGALLLDINCSHGAVGYSVLIRLDSAEEDEYRRRGREFLSQLADRIQQAGPIFPDSESPWSGRDRTRTDGQRVHAAIMAWLRSQDPGPPPAD
jgi:hypothetical protein